jgi:hypothetical protein
MSQNFKIDFRLSLTKKRLPAERLFSKGKMVLKSPPMEARLLSAIKNISAGAMEIAQIVRAPKRKNQKKLLKKRIECNLFAWNIKRITQREL